MSWSLKVTSGIHRERALSRGLLPSSKGERQKDFQGAKVCKYCGQRLFTPSHPLLLHLSEQVLQGSSFASRPPGQGAQGSVLHSPRLDSELQPSLCKLSTSFKTNNKIIFPKWLNYCETCIDLNLNYIICNLKFKNLFIIFTWPKAPIIHDICNFLHAIWDLENCPPKKCTNSRQTEKIKNWRVFGIC